MNKATNAGVSFLVLCALCPWASAAQYHLTDLGPGLTVSALNNQGQVVGNAVFGGETHGLPSGC